MGTRGWIVFFHNGRYYRTFNQFDSYFSGVGKWLVSEISNAQDLPSLLNTWRRLLTLGCPKDGKLCPPTEQDEAAEWKWLTSSLSHDSFVTSLFTNKYGFELENDSDEILTFGDGIFIEYIYVLDLDNEEFIAVEALRDRTRLGYSFEHLQSYYDRVDDWVSHVEDRRAFFFHEFRLPKSILKPITDYIETQGFVTEKEISWSHSACVFPAKRVCDKSKERVYVKVFLPYYGDKTITLTHERSIPFAQVLKKNPHPNIVNIIDVQESGEYPMLVLESYDGSLDDLDLDTPGNKRDYLTALVHAAKGILHMHQLGAVHGDIKLQNILYRRTETGMEAALCDFETVCVPRIECTRDQNNDRERVENGAKHVLDWKAITWGPYSRRIGYGNDGWASGWDRFKCSYKVEYKSGWEVDSSCLAILLDFLIETIEEDSVKSSLEEMKVVLESTNNYHTAIANLEKVDELAAMIDW